ncbi:nuclear transport factor 2 family protein, partial [Rhodococcus erythropolis]|nr:nuclear transport factor 2 family protein [Rhodococcus erythropolis]
MSQAESEVGSISAVEELLAIEEIKRVFAARLRCMDTKQWHVYP